MGVLSSLVSVRTLPAQVTLHVQSISVQGEFESSARCPGRTDTPDVLVVSHHDMTPVNALRTATTNNDSCLSRGRSGMTANFLQTGDRSLQITGSGSVSTFGSVEDGKPGSSSYAIGAARADATVTLELRLSHWSNLSFAGTLSVGTVTAVGSPNFSSVELVQAWDLTDDGGRTIVSRSLSLSSNDDVSQRQDTNYSTLVAGPGVYRLRLTLVGNADGDIRETGATGWTCAGTYGLAISASPACVADFDLNGVLDSSDFFEFLNAFFLDAADFNQDLVVDSQDLFDFLSAFLQGCH